jgi:hypothetical protein
MRTARANWITLVAWVCMTALAATWLPRPVLAADADAPLTTLFDLSADDAAAREIAVDVARALKRSKQVRFRDIDDSLNVGGEEMQVSSVKSGDGFMKAGVLKMKKRQFSDAADDFDNAVGNYLTGFAHLPDATIVAKALGQLGAAQLLAGDAKSAAAAMARAVQADPKYEQDFTEYSANVQQLYDAQRKAVLARAKVDFEVKTTPPNAKVFVNGKYFGLSPVYVKSLAGEQFIAVAKNGWARKAQIAKVDKTDETLAVELEPARRKAAFDSTKDRLGDIFGGAVEPNDLTEAEGIAATPFAVILRTSGTREKMKVELALANLGGRQVVNRSTREIQWLKRDKDVIDKLVDDLLKAPEVPIEKVPEERTKTVFKTWWFWTLVGAVAVGSTAAYLIASKKDPEKPAYQPGQGGLLIQF